VSKPSGSSMFTSIRAGRQLSATLLLTRGVGEERKMSERRMLRKWIKAALTAAGKVE
jgi:hypothetical protein